MFSLSKLALLVVMVTLMVTWVSHDASAKSLAPYPADIEERLRQEIITMAEQIIKLAMNGRPLESSPAKRNGGTLDTLYNLPDLSAIGRR